MARLTVAYAPNLSEHESEPTLMVWPSVGKLPHFWYQMHRLEKGRRVEITIPDLGEAPPWPRGAAIHFQVFSKIKNSEGLPKDEKTGSGQVKLATLMSDGQVKVNLVLQSYLTESSTPVSKGTLVVSGTVHRKAAFREATKYDVVPGNIDHLNSWMLLQVRQDEVAFSAEALRKLGIKFEPTFEETRLVHAPYYNTSIGVLPGWAYFSFLGNDRDANIDDDFYRRLLETAAHRNDRTLNDVTRAIEQQEADRESTRISREYMDAVEIVAASLCQMSTALVYIGDYAYVPDGNGNYVEATVEDFADAQIKHTGDCEDDAKLIARVFRGLRDGKFKNRHVLAAQKVVWRYKGYGTLGSVTSRNIAEAGGGGKPQIGDQRDRSMKVGAHMWFTLVPRHFHRTMLVRTSPSGGIPELEDLRPWEQSMETLVCEGTGPLRPVLKAEEARFESRADKKAAVDREVRLRVAIQRLVVPEGGNQPHEAFHGAMTLRRQEALRSNPEQRLTTFYRVATAFFPIPERDEDEPIFLSKEPLDDDDNDSRQIYSTRALIPVQLGGRHGDNPQRMTWGVNLTDMVYQRKFVGALRTVKPRNREFEVMRAMARHLPPYAPIRYDAASPRNLGIVDEWNRALRAAGIKTAENRWQAEGTTLVTVFWRHEDLEPDQAREIVAELSSNKWVEAADFVYEPLVHGIATVRLQARLRTRDIREVRPEILRSVLG